jgi:hypothetical protein
MITPATSALRVRPFVPADADAWDEFVARSVNGTFLHTRRFLSYAGDRFDDRSLVVESRRGIVGVLPAATHQSDPQIVESHEGLSYGGLVHDGSLRMPAMLTALEAVVDRYYHDGLRMLRYKPVPHVYHGILAADDLYALFRLAATRTRCHLASVIDVANRPAPAQRRVRSLSKAERAGLAIDRGPLLIEPYWRVLTERLATRHDAVPFHTLAELQHLQRHFPEGLECVVATERGQVVAGVLLFHCGTVTHAQYIASSERGLATCAIDLVLAHVLASCAERRVRSLSLGNSTLYGGNVFSESLYDFKSELGAGGVVHETYDLQLA